MIISDPIRPFRNLPLPDPGDEGESFRVFEFGRPEILVGKSQDGRAAFLLHLGQSTGHGLVPLELPNLRVRHNCAVTLDFHEEGHSTEVVSVVECTSNDPDLEELFLACMGHALPLEGPLGNAEVVSVVDHLVELFRASGQPTLNEILGLWAELLVVVSAESPRRLLNAWHSKPESKVDFNAARERVEVKATLGPYRRHNFSFEQLNPPEGVRGTVVSVMTQDLPGATTIFELWQEALEAAGTDNDLRAKIDRICVNTLGKDWARARHTAFDRAMALDTMTMFSCEAIPRIERTPPGVGRVRFESDLSRAEPLDSANLGAGDDSSLIQLLL